MAKRFVDTGILKHHFTRSLPSAMKLLWLHLLTDCNYAGMWQVDWDIASIVVGSKIDPKKAEQIFEKKIIKLKNGAIWFMPDFIDFQYGKLNEKIAAHRSIIKLLRKEDLIDDDGFIQPLPKTTVTPPEGLQDMDKEKEMDMDMEKRVQGGEIPETVQKVTINTFPFAANFYPEWERWITFKKDQFNFRYKTIDTEQTAFNQLVKYSNQNEQEAIEIINTSIANGWKGLFEKEKKQDDNRTSTPEPKFGRLSESSIRNILSRPPLPKPDRT